MSRKLKDLKKGRKAGYKPSLWQLMMIARRRKTMILCASCHDKLHSGKLPDLRQEKEEYSCNHLSQAGILLNEFIPNKLAMESRMH